MKKFYRIGVILTLFFLVACKADKVDGTSTKTFQATTNDMASELPTIRQYKFNEALYILKTFAVGSGTDNEELNALGKLLNGKTTDQIFTLADETAQKNGITWSSSGPPSLGEMNIFGTEANLRDPNDIPATSLAIQVIPTQLDSVTGPRAIVVKPVLLNPAKKPLKFEGTALKAQLEVFSNGKRLQTAKNLIQNDQFRGFVLKFSSLKPEQISNNRIDLTLTVIVARKKLQMTRMGVEVNPRALTKLRPVQEVPATLPDNEEASAESVKEKDSPEATVSSQMPDPKNTVSRFLNNLSANRFSQALADADNPQWSSVETFADPATGFGNIQTIQVQSLKTLNAEANTATVQANYTLIDKQDKSVPLKVTYGLKRSGDTWKITSYKIN